jgi:hypothetical protein
VPSRLYFNGLRCGLSFALGGFNAAFKLCMAVNGVSFRSDGLISFASETTDRSLLLFGNRIEQF